MRTRIYAGFPGVGKSYLFNNVSGISVLDSDSSKFDKSLFPQNYIEHIKSNLGKVNVILVSSHETVRRALVENHIDFYLVYPNKELKQEYIDRYIQRNSSESFIKLISDNWDNWIDDCKNQIGCVKIELQSGQYMSDVLV